MINVLWTIVAGQRFNFKDPKAQRLMELLNRYEVDLIKSVKKKFLKKEKKTKSHQQDIQVEVCVAVRTSLVGPRGLPDAWAECADQDHQGVASNVP